jgi:hypothetical protein
MARREGPTIFNGAGCLQTKADREERGPNTISLSRRRICFISVGRLPAATAGERGGSQGGFLALAGLVCVGIEASLYYWELGFGSLTKSGASGQSGSAWAYLPVGFGVLLLTAGLVLTILDRRAT